MKTFTHSWAFNKESVEIEINYTSKEWSFRLTNPHKVEFYGGYLLLSAPAVYGIIEDLEIDTYKNATSKHVIVNILPMALKKVALWLEKADENIQTYHKITQFVEFAYDLIDISPIKDKYISLTNEKKDMKQQLKNKSITQLFYQNKLKEFNSKIENLNSDLLVVVNEFTKIHYDSFAIKEYKDISDIFIDSNLYKIDRLAELICEKIRNKWLS